jgi:hypothetical protein
VLTVVALAAIALLPASSIVVASNQVTSVVDKQVQTTAAVSSVVIGKQTADLVALVDSYATRPSLADGMVARKAGATRRSLSTWRVSLGRPGISASFVTDLHGTSLSTYPPEPSVYGTNFAYRDWFKGLVASGRPFVSNAIETKEASHALAVTVTDYIRRRTAARSVSSASTTACNRSGRSRQRRSGAGDHPDRDRPGRDLVDGGGAHGLVSLAGDPRVKAALAGRSGLLDYAPAWPAEATAPRSCRRMRRSPERVGP